MIHTLMFALPWRYTFQSKWRALALGSVGFLSFSSRRLQTSVDEASSFCNKAKCPKGWPQRIAKDQVCLMGDTLCLFSQINLVFSGFDHGKRDLVLSNFG